MKYISKINENDMKSDISHNLEVAKPSFIFFIKNMNEELSKWIQYNGVETEGSRIMFKFKSSQNSLNFKIYGGVNISDIYDILQVNTNKIYDYFKEVKYDEIAKLK
jgi:hypothetical protein